LSGNGLAAWGKGRGGVLTVWWPHRYALAGRSRTPRRARAHRGGVPLAGPPETRKPRSWDRGSR